MLRFIDGFDHYNTTADLLTKWSSFSSAPTISATSTRFSTGNCLTNPSNLQKIIDSQSTWTIGMAFKAPSNPGSDAYLVSLIDSTTPQMQWGLNTGGQFIIARNGTKLATSTYVLPSNTWHYVELKVVINGTTGTYELHVDGTAVIGPITGANTQASGNATADRLNLHVIGGTGCSYDDVYMADGQSGTVTTFTGDVRVTTLMPTGAGNYAQWTPDTGSNFARVNETTEDGDTSYVSTATPGNLDSYATADLSGTPTVFGVQVNLMARKDDAGLRQIAPLIRISAADFVGTTQTLGTSYAFFTQTYDKNPNSAAQWAASEVNAAEFGAKLIA